jgi:hypothetical protein
MECSGDTADCLCVRVEDAIMQILQKSNYVINCYEALAESSDLYTSNW